MVSTQDFVIVLEGITLKESKTQHIYPFDHPHFLVSDKFCKLRKNNYTGSMEKIQITQTQRQTKWVFHGFSKSVIQGYF